MVEVIEPAEDVEDMEVVDTVREERLERVRLRQLEWATSVLCKDVIKDRIRKAVEVSEERLCRELIEEEVVEECWRKLEFERIMREIVAGDTALPMKIDQGLRDSREMVEAVEAMVAEEAASRDRPIYRSADIFGRYRYIGIGKLDIGISLSVLVSVIGWIDIGYIGIG